MWWKKRQIAGRYQRMVQSKVSVLMAFIQHKWASYLASKERNWTMLQKKMYCILFFFIAGCGSVLVLLRTIMTPEMKTSSFQVETISRPLTLPPSIEPYLNSSDSLSVVKFRHLLDSMAQSNNGRQTLDSLYRAEPGFLDSFLQMEAIIHHSLK